MNWKAGLAVVVGVAATVVTMIALGAGDTGSKTTNLAGRLRGDARGIGYVQYTHWSQSPIEASQMLAVSLRDTTPMLELVVVVNGVSIGEITTDDTGTGDVVFWNPPTNIPRLKVGDTVQVGPFSGRIAEVPGGGK